MYLYNQFSSKGYVTFNGTAEHPKFEVFEGECVPDLVSWNYILLRYKLMGESFSINRDTFVIMFFDSETFTTSNILVIGVSDTTLSHIDMSKCYPMYLSDGSFVCSNYLNEIVIDYICIAPQVERITSLGFPRTIVMKSSELFIPSSVNYIGLGAISQKNLMTLYLDSEVLDFNIDDLLRLNPKLQSIVVKKMVYDRYCCEKYKDILVCK